MYRVRYIGWFVIIGFRMYTFIYLASYHSSRRYIFPAKFINSIRHSTLLKAEYLYIWQAAL